MVVVRRADDVVVFELSVTLLTEKENCTIPEDRLDRKRGLRQARRARIRKLSYFQVFQLVPSVRKSKILSLRLVGAVANGDWLTFEKNRLLFFAGSLKDPKN